MKKTIVATLTVFSLARRLFTPKGKVESQKALVTRGAARPAKDKQSPTPTLTARQQRRREAIAERKRGRRQRARNLPKRKYALLALKFCLATFGLVASAFGVDSYLASRLSMTPGAAINPVDTFSTPFVLTNGGYLTAKDVEVNCHYDRVIDLSRNLFKDNAAYEIKYDEVRANHPATVQCRLFDHDSPWSEADIRLVVSYRPSFLPWRETETYKFMVVRGPDGTIHWLPR